MTGILFSKLTEDQLRHLSYAAFTLTNKEIAEVVRSLYTPLTGILVGRIDTDLLSKANINLHKEVRLNQPYLSPDIYEAGARKIYVNQLCLNEKQFLCVRVLHLNVTKEGIDTVLNKLRSGETMQLNFKDCMAAFETSRMKTWQKDVADFLNLVYYGKTQQKKSQFVDKLMVQGICSGSNFDEHTQVIGASLYIQVESEKPKLVSKVDAKFLETIKQVKEV